MFSLTGLPPFAGFFLKVELLTNIMSSYFFSTIIILTVVGTFSAFYYIRIIKGLYYEKSTTWLVFNKNINFFSIATCIFLILILNTLFIYNIGAVIHFCLELFTVVYIY